MGKKNYRTDVFFVLGIRFFTDRYYFKLVIFLLETDNLQCICFFRFSQKTQGYTEWFFKLVAGIPPLKKEFFITSREKTFVRTSFFVQLFSIIFMLR